MPLLLGFIKSSVAGGQDATWPGQIRVRRQGLEPRTRGLRVGRLAALGVLPARMPHVDAQKAHIAQGYGWHSSHESSHGIQAELGRTHHSK